MYWFLLFQLQNVHQTEGEGSGSQSEHRCVLFVFMLCSAVTLALGFLTGWHCRLISYGETSIEWHVNKDDAKRLRKQGLVSAFIYTAYIAYTQ